MMENYRIVITECEQCNELFAQIWTDQELCPECKPLACDPLKLELARYEQTDMGPVSTMALSGR